MFLFDMTGFLFDLDGVLIDSELEYSKIWANINQEFPTGVDQLEKLIKGTTLDQILNTYFPDSYTRKAVAEKLHILESRMHYEFLPGAYEFLIEIKKRKFPLALVTSSDNKKMKHLNDEIPGFTDLFDFLVTAEYVKTSKPSPEGYLLAASKIGVKPRNCVVFEDSLQGVMAGKNADSYVVGVVGTLDAETISPYSDILVSSLGEIDLENLTQEVIKR